MKNLILVLSVFAFAGCNGSTGGGATPTPTPAPSATATPAPAPTATPVPSIGCDVESSVISAIVTAVTASGTLNCTNTAAMQSTLQSALGKANFCTAVASAKKVMLKQKAKDAAGSNPQGVLGSLVCQTAMDTLNTVVTGSVIPAAWGCSAGMTLTALEQVGLTACEGAIKF